MWLYSDKKLEEALADRSTIYLTRSVERPYERFNILDTANYAHTKALSLLIMNKKDHKLHLYQGGQSYSLSLPVDTSAPFSAEDLRKSPLREILLAVSHEPLSINIPVSLAVSSCYMRTDTDEKGVKVIQRRSANSRSGHLYEIPDGALLNDVLPILKAAGLQPSDYVTYILQSFIPTTIPKEGDMKEKLTKDTPVFNDVLLNQLDLMQYALADFNQTGSMASVEKLNDSIFNFYVLYYGRLDSHDDNENKDLAEFVIAVSEIAAETVVFDNLLNHLASLDCDNLILSAVRDATEENRDRTYGALKEVCVDFEKQGVIAEMRAYLRTLEAEPEESYLKYRRKQAKKLLKQFQKEYKRLNRKKSAKRYNNFYEALAHIYLHMDLLGLYSETESFGKIKRKLKKYLEFMENYSSRLNMKILIEEYREELDLNNTEVKTLQLPKVSKKELKKLISDTVKSAEKLA